MQEQGVSVILCCYNSAARLPQTLQHLAGQVVPPDFYWEILLVNNASKDDTVATAHTVWAQQQPVNVTLRIVDEPQPGLVYARKCGVREAQYDCIIFCDDDNWLGESYIHTAWQVMQQDGRIGAAGGQNAPVSDIVQYPDWFDAYKAYYATGIPAPDSGDVTERGYLLGAGLVTRKHLFQQVLDDRYPSLLTGRNGEQLSAGEDFEYVKRLMLWEYKLYYDKRLTLQHFIPRERLTMAYRDRLLEGIHAATRILGEYDRALYLLKYNRHKNRWRLLLLAPFRIFMAKAGWSGRDYMSERMKFFYLAPFPVKGDPIPTAIKHFLQHK